MIYTSKQHHRIALRLRIIALEKSGPERDKVISIMKRLESLSMMAVIKELATHKDPKSVN